MDVTPLVPSGAQIIQAYADGTFRISGTVHDGAVIVFPDQTVNWTVSTDMGVDDFAPLLARASELDVVLLGLGAGVANPPFELRRALKDRGLAVDFMDTGAACRTYNVLMAEGRRVAAALLPV
ncbi:Mth938-like domain-containing protein [Micavibrio aeruginosavorus]|uniref:Uncharacterized protein n=1 Tax=Micavibrio aeruginosavorus EPB TaxID=349215 RepID=M4VWL0_9BACT|nr:Mth938-like domain-containing protein [Micavibrio aeruginosavorus]AGH97579.1 hypothetical protein A11S_756 [Micavibrio aeruginosavorus EPB]